MVACWVEELKLFTADFSSLQSFIPLCTTGGGGSLYRSHTHRHKLLLEFNQTVFSSSLPPSSLSFCLSWRGTSPFQKPISLFFWQLLQVSVRCDRFGPSTPHYLSVLICTILAGSLSVYGKMQRAILTGVLLTSARPFVFLSFRVAGDSRAALLEKQRGRSLRFSYINDLFNVTLQRGALSRKSILSSPPCRVLHDGIGGLNVMTASSEAHTQHARRPTEAHTHTRCQITLSLLSLLSLLFSSPLSSVSSSRSHIPGLFSPFLSLPLFWCPCPFTFKSPRAFFIMTKEQLQELTTAGVHGNSPSSSLSPLIKAFPEPHPTPLTLWQTPYLQNLLMLSHSWPQGRASLLKLIFRIHCKIRWMYKLRLNKLPYKLICQ